MYYVFREDGDGEVRAEARCGDVYGSYLGLRFPGSDIPQVARDLYRINPWRSIPDALAEPVPLRAADARDMADLSYSDLRSVSPMHRVYLSNMSVRASLSFPVVIGATLEGLVAAHHSQAGMPPLHAMERAAALVRSHARWLTDDRATRRMRLIDGLHHHFDSLDVGMHDGDALRARWSEVAERLCRDFEADGATLCAGAEHACYGLTFEAAAREAFDRWFIDSCGAFVWLGEHLAHDIPAYPTSEVAGALALRLTDVGGVPIRVYLTRGESIHEVSWGGNPDKPFERHDGQLGIAPRLSFEKWVERRVGHARAWDGEARLLALALRKMLYQRLHS
jgi:light-regulated signal transduction histidine kinase (bacteriophytochrome)